MGHALGAIRRLVAVLGIAAACGCFASAAYAKPPKAHIVIDAASGKELIARAPDLQIYPASLTKMMTLYLLFDELEAGRLKLSSRIPFSRRAAARPPSKLGVKAGNSISVKTAIQALAIKSANDVAYAVAEKIGGSAKGFVKQMNAKATTLGMARTTFKNPSGLPHSGQVSTPRDMAQLARALRYRHKRYYRYFGAKSFKYGGRTYRTHNRFLKSYSGADGVKTGYINASGFNFAGSAVRNGRRLIGVIVGGKTSKRRDQAFTKLMNAGFKKAKQLGRPHYSGVLMSSVDWNTGRTAEPPRRKPFAPVVASAPAKSRSPAASARPVAYAAQVGAVATKDDAAQMAAASLKALGGVIQGGETSVTVLTLNNGKKLFRARIAGLTDTEARQACRTLQQKGRACLVVTDRQSG